MLHDIEMFRKLLIIDDEENMLHMLEALLSRSGYKIEICSNGAHALEILEKQNFNFILCDIKMPGMDGLQFLEEMKKIGNKTTVIMMSAYGSIDLAISSMQSGAYDFISKPFKKDEVLLSLKKAEERESLRQENFVLKEELRKVLPEIPFSKIIWKSKVMENVLNTATKVAQYDTTVLITGESGTGKELLAQGIHQNSLRGHCQFIAINCGSIPGELIESELFGYVKGAFTGADRDKKGVFEEADGGTIFLDEIGELPFPMQVKLLRVLQENEIRPIGSNTSKKVNARVLAATSKKIEDEVRGKRFRSDLFYRLNVINLVMPPLRERNDDIPELCSHFLKKYNNKFELNVRKIEPKVMDAILKYSWPGNVRELENVIQRGVVLAENGVVNSLQLPDNIKNYGLPQITRNYFEQCNSLKEAKKYIEAQYIEHALIEANGNKSQVARLLEMSYPSLLNKIKEYGL